jgi:hypothetical protein
MDSFHARRGWQAYLTVEREVLRQRQRDRNRLVFSARGLGRFCRRALICGVGLLTCVAGWNLVFLLLSTRL